MPCIQQTMFFPNRDNETKLASLLRKAKRSLDICVFAFTNDRFRDAILYAYERFWKWELRIGNKNCEREQ